VTDSKQYFDTIGAGWDEMQERFFSDRVRDRAFEVAKIEAGRTAVDVGAGTGFLSGALLGHGMRVISVDQSKPMLDGLRAKYPDDGGLECRVGEAERIPVDDGTADFCFANMCLHHVERPAAAIREMARVLKPGGKLVITDLDSHEQEFLRVEHHDRWMGFDRDQVHRWFTEAGLDDVLVEGIDEECCTASHEGKQASIGIFVAQGRRRP
jgi:ubiquinone/menaquinone biosynthesis C-methylase UbiE